MHLKYISISDSAPYTNNNNNKHTIGGSMLRGLYFKSIGVVSTPRGCKEQGNKSTGLVNLSNWTVGDETSLPIG
jgi:hypothetical protein